MKKYYLFPVFYLVLLFISIRLIIPQGTLQSIRTTQYFALSALVFLYLTLFVDVLNILNRSHKLVKKLYRGYPIFLFSTFVFALAHATFGLFTQLGGVGGLLFLTGRFLYAVVLAAIALVLLAVSQLKPIRRLTQIAGVFVLIHAFFIGTHFSDLSLAIPQLIFVITALLLILYAIVLDRFIRSKFIALPVGSITTFLSIAFISSIYFKYFSPTTGESTTSVSIHAEHLKQAQQNTTAVALNRYSVGLSAPANISPNQNVQLKFDIYDAASGNRIEKFNLFQEKLMHLIIVDANLEYFNHIHPEILDGQFIIETQFPHTGKYHLYTDFEPEGATEQQYGFSLVVDAPDAQVRSWQPDMSPKTIDNYQISLSTPQKLLASEMTLGNQILKFNITDAQSGESFTNLKPYLGAFGHMVMINTQTYDYLHVHPVNQNLAAVGDAGGPVVEFSPLGMFGPIKPGIYRLFAQFNPNGELITTDFTIEIE